MIDYENLIFDTVAQALRAAFPGISVDSEQSDANTPFPRVFFSEEHNAPAKRYLTQEYAETFVDVMFEAQAYSNKQSGRRAQAKAIIDTIDSEMWKLGFVRILSAPMENLQDTTIARRVARWEGTISADGTVYRR